MGLRSERGPVLLAIMMTTGLVAIEATILATAVPSIVDDLGGRSAFPWLFSVYLLAQAVSVPVYAKLADTIGRKPIMLFGIGLFLVGSLLCGFAWSMPALIAFRVVQGLGAGAVQPMSMTMIGDIYTIQERARTQGYVASVWAVASVIGPTLGGLFAQLDAWRLIFFVNLPIGLLAMWLIVRNFRERVEPTVHRIDYGGAALLTFGLSLILLGVLEGGVAWAWNSPVSVAVFVAGALLLAGFALVERRAAEPVLPLWVFTRPLLLTTSLLSIGIGAILIGVTTFVPAYLDGSIGAPPLIAGFALAAMTIGWPVSASISGRIYLRIGFKRTILIGSALTVGSAAALAVVGPTPSVLGVAAVCFALGLGLGLVAAPQLIVAQASVQWDERGVVTGANMFARSLGSAVGAAVLGAIANSILFAPGADDQNPATVTTASTAVFIGVFIAAVASLIAAMAMPRDRALPRADAARIPDRDRSRRPARRRVREDGRRGTAGEPAARDARLPSSGEGAA